MTSLLLTKKQTSLNASRISIHASSVSFPCVSTGVSGSKFQHIPIFSFCFALFFASAA